MANQTSYPAGNPVGDRAGGDTPKPGAEGAPGTDVRSLLTREEIEALLGAGRAAPGGVGAEALAEAAPHPFERFPLLQPVFERLAEGLGRALGRLAGAPVQASLDSASSARLGDYLENIPLPALLAVWRADAWGGGGLAAIDGALARALFDALLGGRRYSGPARDGRRAYTPIDRAVAERLFAAVLDEAEAAFRPVAPAGFRLERMETDARLAQVAPATGRVALARFAVTLEKRGGRIELALPYAALDAAGGRLAGRAEAGDPQWQGRIARELDAAEVKVEAVLDRMTVKLRDVLGWKPGARVKLDATPETPVELRSGGVGLMQGKLGRAGDRLAVRVERWIARRHELD
jgi:flagellar motor switch protein FliM